MKKYLVVISIILGCLLLLERADAVLFTDEEVLKQVEMIKEGGRKFLIINADDFGLSSNTNRAVIETFLHGVLTSATVMIPAPKADEVAEFQKKYPQADIGVHLTLTSEWEKYKWGPLLGKDKVPSLVEKGTPYFWPDTALVLMNANPDEVKMEIIAQVEKAKEMGILITHLDCHMGWYHFGETLFDAIFPYIVENRFPVREVSPGKKKKLKRKGIITIDSLVFPPKGETYEDMKKNFIQILKKLPIGITEVYFHPSYPDEGIMPDNASKIRDWERKLLLDEEIINTIKDESIVLIGYKPLQILSR